MAYCWMPGYKWKLQCNRETLKRKWHYSGIESGKNDVVGVAKTIFRDFSLFSYVL